MSAITSQFEVVGLKIQQQGGLFEAVTAVHTAMDALEATAVRQILKKRSFPHPGTLRVLTNKWDVQPDACVNDPSCKRIQLVGQLDFQS